MYHGVITVSFFIAYPVSPRSAEIYRHNLLRNCRSGSRSVSFLSLSIAPFSFSFFLSIYYLLRSVSLPILCFNPFFFSFSLCFFLCVSLFIFLYISRLIHVIIIRFKRIRTLTSRSNALKKYLIIFGNANQLSGSA